MKVAGFLPHFLQPIDSSGIWLGFSKSLKPHLSFFIQFLRSFEEFN